MTDETNINWRIALNEHCHSLFQASRHLEDAMDGLSDMGLLGDRDNKLLSTALCQIKDAARRRSPLSQLFVERPTLSEVTHRCDGKIPIATAPRDGSVIRLHDKSDEQSVEGFWSDGRWMSIDENGSPFELNASEISYWST